MGSRRLAPPGVWPALAVTLTVALALVALAGWLHRLLPWNTASGQIATTLATVAFVGVTYLNIEVTRRMVWHFRETREGEFRPYVVARWFPHEPDGGAVLQLEALGRGVACDLRVDLSPSSLRTPEGRPLRELPLLLRGLEVLVPGTRLSIAVDAGSLPRDEELCVRVAYDDFYVRGRGFREEFRLRPQALAGIQVSGDAGS